MTKIYNFTCLLILLWPLYLTFKLGSRSLNTLYSKALVMWTMSQMAKLRVHKYALKKIFAWSALMLTFDLQPLFNVTEHSFTISTLLVKYQPHWSKVRKDMLCSEQEFFIWFCYDLNLWPMKQGSRSLQTLYPKPFCW